MINIHWLWLVPTAFYIGLWFGWLAFDYFGFTWDDLKEIGK